MKGGARIAQGGGGGDARQILNKFLGGVGGGGGGGGQGGGFPQPPPLTFPCFIDAPIDFPPKQKILYETLCMQQERPNLRLQLVKAIIHRSHYVDFLDPIVDTLPLLVVNWVGLVGSYVLVSRLFPMIGKIGIA